MKSSEKAFEPVFNLSSFLTRIRRGGSGAPAHPPTRRAASGSPYEGATAGRRLGTWVTTRDAINSVWYQSADQLVARSRDIIRKTDGLRKRWTSGCATPSAPESSRSRCTRLWR